MEFWPTAAWNGGAWHGDPDGRSLEAPRLHPLDHLCGSAGCGAWLAKAFGFEPTMAITADDPDWGHWELAFEGGMIMIGGIWSDQVKTPRDAGGNTQSVHVHLKNGLDEHCERARRAGAVIVREPAEEFYGDRVYVALDPEGHRWTFAQTTRYVSREEAEKASGLKIEGWAEPA